MSITIKEDTDLIYNRNYKVCHYVDNKKISTNTFTNKLVNADGTHFWFSSIENGLAVVRQDTIVWMGCIDEPKKVEKFPESMLFTLCKVDDINTVTYDRVNDFITQIGREPKCIKCNINTLRDYLSYRNIHGYKYEFFGISIVVNNTLSYGMIELT